MDVVLVHAEVVADLVPHRLADLLRGRIPLAEDDDPIDAPDRVVDAHEPGRMAVLDDYRHALELRRDRLRKRIERLLHRLSRLRFAQQRHLRSLEKADRLAAVSEALERFRAAMKGR